MLLVPLSLALLAFDAAQPTEPKVPSTMADAKIELELKLETKKTALALSITSRDGKDFTFSPAWLASSNVTIQTESGPVTLEGGAEAGAPITLPGGTQIYREIPLDAHRAAIEKGAELRWKSGSLELGPIAFSQVLPTVAGPNGSEDEIRAYFAKMQPAALANHFVTLKTTKGDMKVEFYPDKAPNHVRNFLTLSLSGYFKDKKFHRIMKDFMIQGGCPLGTGSGSHGPRVNLEPSDLKHTKGVLSMARTNDPNSATCQFFIMTATNPGLDRQYSAFGKVVNGMDTLDKIASTPVGPSPQGEMSVPKEEVKVTDVVVVAPSKISN